MEKNQRDVLMADLMRMLAGMDPTDPAMAGIKFFRDIDAFIKRSVKPIHRFYVTE